MVSAIKNRLWKVRGEPGKVLQQTGFLFAVDMVANVVDYAFHVYLGRMLVPGDFAVFQTINSALLIIITATGVMQPVVARFVAENEGAQSVQSSALSAGSARLFREYFVWSALMGVFLAGVVWMGRSALASGLNIPIWAVKWGVGVVFLVLLRPVVAGVLQGTQRFGAFGAVRLVYALGRFAVTGILLFWGWALRGAVISLPVGQFLAVVGGLVFLGWRVWTVETGAQTGGNKFLPGLRLAGWAFLAFTAHTAILNLDMLWVNRMFSPEEAGSYATMVLLRRILLLLPGAAVVVLYPRVAKAVAQKQVPDRAIFETVGIVTVLMGGLVVGYFVAGGAIVRLAFGEGYAETGTLLGWMGVGILGYGLGTIWLNVFLATHPGPFVGLLIGTVLLQGLGLVFFAGTMLRVAGVFVLTGWTLALGGAFMYGVWLRPRLRESI